MTLEEQIRETVRTVVREELRQALAELRPNSAELLSVEEAAELAGVNPATVRKWMRQGLRRHGAGRVWRVLRSDLLAWLESGARQAPQGEPTDEDIERRVVDMLRPREGK